MVKSTTKAISKRKGRGNPNIAKHGFKKGHDRGGRPKGAQGKITRDIKEAIMIAAEMSKHSDGQGMAGYMTYLADEKPVVYAGLVGRLIPVQANVKVDSLQRVDVSVDTPLGDMIQEFERRIKTLTVGPNKFERIENPEPLVIEHDPDENA